METTVWKRDLIDLVTLSRLFAKKNDLELSEASSFVTNRISDSTLIGAERPIKVYAWTETSHPWLNKSNGAWMVESVHKSNWWKSDIMPMAWGGNYRADQIGILRTDAESVFGIVPPSGKTPINELRNADFLEWKKEESPDLDNMERADIWAALRERDKTRPSQERLFSLISRMIETQKLRRFGIFTPKKTVA